MFVLENTLFENTKLELFKLPQFAKMEIDESVRRIQAVMFGIPSIELQRKDIDKARLTLEILERANLRSSSYYSQLMIEYARLEKLSKTQKVLESFLLYSFKHDRLENFMGLLNLLPSQIQYRWTEKSILMDMAQFITKFDPSISDFPHDLIEGLQLDMSRKSALRIMRVTQNGIGALLEPIDAEIIAKIVTRRDLTARVNCDEYEQLVFAATARFPKSVVIKRQALRVLRVHKNIKKAFPIARELSKHPKGNLNDFFFRVRLLSQLGKAAVIDRYIQYLKNYRMTSAEDEIEKVAGRLWATGNPNEALRKIGDFDAWCKTISIAQIALQSLVTARRYPEAEKLIHSLGENKFSPSYVQQVKDAMQYLNTIGGTAPEGADTALYVAQHWISMARQRKVSLYTPQSRRVMVSSYSLGIGGAERQVTALLAGLCAEQDIESVHLLVHTTNKNASYEISGPAAAAKIHPIHKIVEDTSDANLLENDLLKEIKDHCARFGLGHLFRSILAITTIAPEVVHVRGGLHAELSLAALIAGTPSILVQFGSMTRGFQSTGSDLDRMREKFVEQLLGELADFNHIQIAANSRMAANDWATAMGVPETRVVTIHNAIVEENIGFDKVTFTPPSQRRSLVVGSVFRFAPVKDPLMWVDVAARVHKAVPSAKFLLVGDGPMWDATLNKIKALGLWDAFELPGLVTDGVAKFLTRMDVFLMTTTTESLPNSVIEAQLAGIPVVAPRVGGLPEAVAGPETSMLTERDTEVLAQAVIKALNDLEWRQSTFDNAPNIIREKFSTDALVRNTRHAYGW